MSMCDASESGTGLWPVERELDFVKELNVNPLQISSSLFYFLIAALCEIGGGYLVWLWLREGKGFGYAALGGIALILYGIIPTFQQAHFGRVYAAYGGVFIVLSVLWGWRIDKIVPDRFDLIGSALALAGVLIMMYWPREAA
jgi:small multidrug resistance family-3 protein